jgi:hypothetical protein
VDEESDRAKGEVDEFSNADEAAAQEQTGQGAE